MKKVTSTCILIFILFQSSMAQNPTMSGTVWIDEGDDNIFIWEQGLNDMKVILKSAVTNETIDSTVTENFEFNFPSLGASPLFPGMYYLEVAIDEYIYSGLIPCGFAFDADDGVDNDDNGTFSIPLISTTFTLDTSHVDYVDICLTFECFEPVPFALPSCDEINDADIFCNINELDNICGVMPMIDSPGNQPNPLCPNGGGTHNISWFAFIADEGDYTMTVTPTACTGSTIGIEGVQMGLYTDCTFTDAVFCEADCSTDPISVSSDVLIPGERYYFFIDGCSGSVCAYDIQIDGNPIPYTPSIEEVCLVVDGNLVCEDTGFCTGEVVTFETNSFEDTDYTWSVATLSGGPYIEDPSPATEENNIELIFNSEGIYFVCIEQVDNGCTIWTGSECKTVTIEEGNVGVEEFTSISICEDMISQFDVSMLEDQDPNGDGFSGWIDSAYVFSAGQNESTTSDSFYCAFKQVLNIIPIENAEISLEEVDDDFLCLGDTVQLEFETISDFDSIVWSINNIQQTDSIGSIIPEAGENEIIATLYNFCGSSVDTITFQVKDTLKSPDIICDTSVVGSIILTWSPVDGIEEYWLSINDGDFIIVSDTSYIIENLDSGEVVEIKSNIIDQTKCFGFATAFTCKAATFVSITEQSPDDIRVVPNPVLDYLNIDGEYISSNTTYSIYSIDGRQIMTGNINKAKQINVENLSPGLYLIAIDQNHEEIYKIMRFVKQ